MAREDVGGMALRGRRAALADNEVKLYGANTETKLSSFVILYVN